MSQVKHSCIRFIVPARRSLGPFCLGNPRSSNVADVTSATARRRISVGLIRPNAMSITWARGGSGGAWAREDVVSFRFFGSVDFENFQKSRSLRDCSNVLAIFVVSRPTCTRRWCLCIVLVSLGAIGFVCLEDPHQVRVSHGLLKYIIYV